MIKKLKEELINAAKSYYHDGKVIMSDEDYDDKLEYLSQLVTPEDLENDEELKQLFESPSAGTSASKNLVEHAHPMLSLAKAKNEDDLKKYYDKLTSRGAKGFSLQTKLDGLAMSVTYTNGVISEIATRGDGVHGESMLYLKDSSDLTIKNLPDSLPKYANSILEVRGEIFARESQFKVFNKNRKAVHGDEFANSRNAVAGMVKKALGGLGYKAEITFVVYSAYLDGKSINPTTIEKSEGFLDAKTLTQNEIIIAGGNYLDIVEVKDYKELEAAVRLFGPLRPYFDVPTDGVVIKPLNEVEMFEELGNTSHHPVAYIAYKYPGEKAVTTVRHITVSVGKTGALTPQAEVEPVEVDGSVLTNFTCHNFNWLYEKGIREGATVVVTKANDVIPAIESVLVHGDTPLMTVPTACPHCDTELIHVDVAVYPSKTIYCPNEECPSRILFYIRSILGRTFLHIDGIGDVVLEALSNQGKINSITDLFALKVEDMEDLVIGQTSIGNDRKLGRIRSQKIRDSIDNAMKNTPDFRLLGSLGIDGIGPNTSKKLIAHFGSLMNVLQATKTDFELVEGFGPVKVESITKSQPRLIALMEALLSMGVVINEAKIVKPDEVKGSFSVSGSVDGFANREDFVAHMESQGWEFHKSPKSTTTVLFADPNGTSSKIKKARANGTRIIESLEDL